MLKDDDEEDYNVSPDDSPNTKRKKQTHFHDGIRCCVVSYQNELEEPQQIQTCYMPKKIYEHVECIHYHIGRSDIVFILRLTFFDN